MNSIKVQITALILFFSLSLSGCHSQPVQKYRVAALLKSSKNPYFAMMWGGIKKEADDNGIKVDRFWPTSESDFKFQSDFLKKQAFRYDALIIAPSNPAEIAALLPPLKRAGKKIVILDEGIPIRADGKRSDFYDSFVATDNAAGGRIAAEFAKHFIKPGNQVVVMAGFNLTKPRTLAFKHEIESTNSRVHINEFIGDYDREKTRRIVAEHLALFTKSAAVFCANDHMALGVIDELSARGVKKMPIIIGYDSVKEAIEEVLRGRMAASVVQYPFRMGERGIQDITKLLRGEAVSPETLMPPRLSIRKATIQETELSAVSAVFKKDRND